MDYSSYYPKNMLVENELEKQHILQTLADKDINAKFTGKKSVVVHKDNVTKAKAHLKKIGMHNDYVVTHDTSMNEEVVEEAGYYPLGWNDMSDSAKKAWKKKNTEDISQAHKNIAKLAAQLKAEKEERECGIEESSIPSADYKISKDGRKYPASRISFKDYNKKQEADLKESVSVKYEYQDDGKHIAHVNTKDKDGNTESHSYAANDKATLQKHIKKTHSAHMKSDNDLGGFKQKTEHEFIEDNSSSAAKGKTVKTISGLKVRTTK